MGDRATFGFRKDKNSQPIWLYSHWGGVNRVHDLANAIEAARPRWTDYHYANRIAISQIVGDDWSGELGYGISLGEDMPHPDYDTILIVNWESREVEFWEYESTPLNAVHPSLNFEIFIAEFAPGSVTRG